METGPLHSWQIEKVAIHSLGLAICSGLSYGIMTTLLSQTRFVSRDDNLLGGMWAAISAVFVFRDNYKHSVTAAMTRLLATAVSSSLCFFYLLIFPFHTWGLAALIGIGAAIAIIANHPEATITASITTTVIMVVAELSPREAWLQPIFRLADTFVGAVAAVAVAVSAQTLYIYRERNYASKTSS
jgi:uncharacterized membrane protein YgaE (UPF0421/DUF939 family)